MKVICVKKFPPVDSLMRNPIPSPEVGDQDIVIDETIEFGHIFYSLERFGLNACYRSDYFAILPDATADEMQEEEREAIIM